MRGCLFVTRGGLGGRRWQAVFDLFEFFLEGFEEGVVALMDFFVFALDFVLFREGVVQ